MLQPNEGILTHYNPSRSSAAASIESIDYKFCFSKYNP